MVSRGSSMFIEGIEELKSITAQLGKRHLHGVRLCRGHAAGLGRSMWSESVVINRISLFGVPWLMRCWLCLMRWMYAPQQRRYLYLAMFFYGMCATIHQTLLLSAMGVEVAIAAAQPRLGRDLFPGQQHHFSGRLLAMSTHAIPALQQHDARSKPPFSTSWGLARSSPASG